MQEKLIQVFARKGNNPYRNFQIDGLTSPYSVDELYQFIREGYRIEELAMATGSQDDPLSVRTGKKIDFRRNHVKCVEALQAGDDATYKRIKSYRFPAVVWSGVPNRHKNTTTFQSTGRLNLDIDARPGWDVPDDVTDRLQELPYFEAFGRSPSGCVPGCNNGWANFLIEIPDSIPPEDLALTGMKNTTTVEIYSTYARLITAILHYELALPGASYGDAKRLRYLIYDPRLVWVKTAVPLRWAELLNLWPKYCATRPAEGQPAPRAAIKPGAGWEELILTRTLEHMAFHNQTAEVGFLPGMRHQYYLSFAFVCLDHGIALESAQDLFDRTWGEQIKNEPNEVAEQARTLSDIYTKHPDRFGRRAGEVTAVSVRSRQITLSAGEYLSDKVDQSDLENVYLIAPTGSGKTRAIASCFSEPVIMLTPLNSLVRSVAEKYGFRKVTAARDDRETGIDWSSPPDAIICVYASFPRTLRELTAADLLGHYHLVIDEAHYFATATSPGFMLREMQTIWEARKHFRSCTLMTGTPVHIHGLDLTRLEVEVTTRRRKTFRIVEFETPGNRRQADGHAEYIRDLRSGTPEGTPILVWQNDKVQIRPIFRGHFAECEWVDFVDAHTKDLRPEFWQNLSVRGHFPDPVEVLFCTSTLKEGLDFDRYTGECHVVVTHNMTVEDLQQFSERFRRAEVIHIHYLTSEQEFQYSNRDIDPISVANWLERRTLDAQAPFIPGIDKQAGKNIRALASFGSAIYSKVTPSGEVEVDPIAITHQTYNIVSNYRRKYLNLFLSALKEYHIEVLPSERRTAPTRPAEVQAAIDTARDEMQDQREVAYTETVDTLFAAKGNIVEAALRYTRHRNHQLAMGEADAVITIHDWLDRIARRKGVYLDLMPPDNRFNKSHQRAVGARLFIEWLMLQPGCPHAIRQVYHEIMNTPNGYYSARFIQHLAARSVTALEDIGGMFSPFSIQTSRRLLRPFYSSYKRGDQYELIKFELPSDLTYIGAVKQFA